ncbi:hypothetical protein [Aminipila sp.]|uniref:hypothetical protein n=1 Tax=Aminipila sp. TaxID=2060095 RepID=UPI000ECFA139|nr:hypothetical protein [Aminipila sp.]HCX62777.1 hypothetical protein [Clostridiales bacterium]
MRHHYCTLKARGVRGRNTENREIGKDVELAEYQGKRHVILKFTYEQKHVIFNPIGAGKREKEICEGVQVVLAIFS